MQKHNKYLKIALLMAFTVCFLLVGSSTAQETPLTEPIITNYLNSFLLFGLGIICIILTLKPQVPILNFVFGIITLGVAAASAGQTDLLLYGFVQLFAIVLALVCIFQGNRNR